MWATVIGGKGSWIIEEYHFVSCLMVAVSPIKVRVSNVYKIDLSFYFICNQYKIKMCI